MPSEEDIKRQQQNVLRHLSRSLQGGVARYERTLDDKPCRTFPDYKKARADYMELQAMIFTIMDKSGEMKEGVPKELEAWLIRMRLRAVATFTKISVSFFRDPPPLLIRALGAYEILEMEKDNFSKVLVQYDELLFQAGLDDKTADELDKVRIDMEEVVERLGTLLQTAPPPLVTF